MTKPKYPIFLSGKPLGEDKFAGGAHKKTAKIITETIKAELLEKRVLGLQGEWGSGKSNVVKIIQNQLGKEYYTFVFDSWGNQEDLTRKSFLEQLISQLFNNSFLTDAQKWKKLERQLLSKSSKTHKEKFPKTKPYWILLTLSVLLFAGLSSFYDNVLSINNNIIKSVDFGSFWKPVLFIYLIPGVLLLLAIILGCIDFVKARSVNSEKDILKQEGKWDTLGKIFYWFSGQEVDTEESESVLEDDPSVKKFREYFSQIELDLSKNKKKLVIVFDNIDRLEEEKIKALWSSIHTFFAEDDKSVNSWIIVPYDKTKLHDCFGGNGFIEKTFAINFRVTPPVVTDWEGFLNDSIDYAFGEEIIPAKEKEFIIKLFDILSDSTTIKPRQVLNYVNDLVAQYLQWEVEVKSGEIKIRYLALFILTKDEISKKPNEIILSRSYLKTAIGQFDNLAELDESIAAITFGVEKTLANEVLLFRELQTIFREGDIAKLDDFSNHAAFDNYFYKAYSSLELPDKINGLVNILGSASDFLSEQRISQYWNDFAKKILDIDNQFEIFNDNHRAILSNSPVGLSKKVLVKLIETLQSKIDEKDESTQNKYYVEILKIEEFLKENPEIKIDIFKILKPVSFNAVPLINLVSKTKKEYVKYKIASSNSNLIGYFFEDEESDEDLNLEKVTDYLNEVEILDDEYDFSKITEEITEQLKTIAYNEKEEITKHINILKRLNTKSLVLELSPTFYNQLTKPRLEEDEVYYDAFSIGIANFDTAIKYQNFINTLNTLSEENIEGICSKIEWYIDYDDILLMVSENPKTTPYINLKLISQQLTFNSYGSSLLLLKNILPKYSTVLGKVFDDDLDKEKKFLGKLEGWHSQIKEDIDVSKFDERFFHNLHSQEFELIKKVTSKTLKYFEGLSKEEIKEAFVSKDKNYVIIENLTNNNLIEKYTDNFYGAFDDYMKSIALETESLPDDSFWSGLIDKLDARKLKSTYTSIRDILINDRGLIKEEEILFFITGLLPHGNLDKRSDDSTLNIITPIIESDIGFELFLANRTRFLKIINAASEHKESAIRELQIRYNSDKYKENTLMKEIANDLNLKVIKDESE